MNFSFVKMVVFVPLSHADKVRNVLADKKAGQIGNYDSCSFSGRGMGRFRPLKGANPAIGEVGKIEEVEEERIEVIIAASDIEKIMQAVKKVHPYEEPAIDIYPLFNKP